MKNYFLRHKVFCIYLAVVFPLIIVVGSLTYIEYAPIMRGEFTPEAWDNHPHFRYKMVDDMEATLDIRNLTRDEVMDALGENHASIEEYGVSYVIRTNTLFYVEYYVVVFAADGKVKSIERFFDL